MAFCSKCGKEINDEAVVCIHCGCQTSKGAVSNNTDRPATGVEILLTVLEALKYANVAPTLFFLALL